MRSFYNEAQVVVEGEPLTLVLNLNAVGAIEGVTGMNMPEILRELGPDCSHKLAATFLWGLLRHKHEGVTPDEAYGVAMGPDGGKVGLAMSELINRSYDHSKAKDENPPKRRGRSRNSGKNG